MKLFLQKNAKFSSAGGSAPRPPKQPPPLRISGYAPGWSTGNYNIAGPSYKIFLIFFNPPIKVNPRWCIQLQEINNTVFLWNFNTDWSKITLYLDKTLSFYGGMKFYFLL